MHLVRFEISNSFNIFELLENLLAMIFVSNESM